MSRAPSSARTLIGISAVVLPAVLVSAAEPTLYERIALGPIIVHGRCRAVERRAQIDVREVLKGSYHDTHLQVRYKTDNFNRSPGAPRIEFQPEQESILVLEPEKEDNGKIKAPDRFVLVSGYQGKIDLPAEGAQALLEAVRRVIAIQGLSDQNAIWEAQRALIRERNPLLVQAGFEEILKFRLGCEEIAGPLLVHLSGPRPEFRRLSLRVLGQIFADGRRKGSGVPSQDLLVREALARAMSDEASEIRAEAVRALRETHRQDLVESLKHLAADDPAQTVRYEAQVALIELEESRGGSGSPSSGPAR